MANTIIQADAPDGLTLTLKLYAVNGDTIQNGAGGDAMTQRTNALGTYTATVTEALAATFEVRLTNASDQTIAKYVVTLVDDTGTYICVDRIDSAVQTDLDTLTGSDGATLATTQGNYAPAKATDILTTALTEAYAADGSAPTLSEILFLISQHLSESSISSTTKTVKKLDGTTSAATFTLDSATTPTSITRAT